MNTLPKVSIITVCFNSEATIADTIQSVIHQDYPNIEYIIIDGVSKDRTLEIIQKYSNHISKVISEKDQGIYDAMNKGIAHATGDIIGILNSDDFYSKPSSVSTLIEKMQSTGSDTVFSNLLIVDPVRTNKVIRVYRCDFWKPWMLRFGWMPAHPTFFVKRKVYEACGKYSLKYKIASDYEMMVRIFYKNHFSFAHASLPVVKMRAGGASMRGLKTNLQLNREIVRACRENGLATYLGMVLLKTPFKLMEKFLWKRYV